MKDQTKENKAKGKDAIIKFGKKAIEIVRQNCMKKYGSFYVNEKQARGITDEQDEERRVQAAARIKRYREYIKVCPKQLEYMDHVKLFRQIQAGNSHEMSRLTYFILSQSVPLGVKVQRRCTKNKPDDEQHCFVCVKPLNAANDDLTYVVDPFPSHQLLKSEVILKKDHFCEKFEQQILEQFTRFPNLISPDQCKDYEGVEEVYFYPAFIEQIEKEINNMNSKWEDPLWVSIQQKEQKLLKFENFQGKNPLDERFKIQGLRGKNAMIKFGKMTIELIRQNCLRKYGSQFLNESQERGINQFQDLQRRERASVRSCQYRGFMEKNFFRLAGIDHIRLLRQLQAGDCVQMAMLSYHILNDIVPNGVKIETRRFKNVPQSETHRFVCVKPLNAQNDDHTLIIDPWPSNQLIKAEVTTVDNFFGDKYQHEVVDILSISKGSNNQDKEKFKTFDFLDENDFDIKRFNELVKIINTRNELCGDPEWLKQNQITKSIQNNPKSYRQLSLAWLNIMSRKVKYVTKNQNKTPAEKMSFFEQIEKESSNMNSKWEDTKELQEHFKFQGLDIKYAHKDRK